MTTFYQVTSKFNLTEAQPDSTEPVDAAAEPSLTGHSSQSTAVVPYRSNSAIVLSKAMSSFDAAPAIVVSMPELRVARRSSALPGRLVGAGMITATVVSGLMLVDSVNKQSPVDATANLPKPQTQPKQEMLRSAVSLPTVTPPETEVLEPLSLPQEAEGELSPVAQASLFRIRLAETGPQSNELARSLPEAPLSQRFSPNHAFKLGEPTFKLTGESMSTVAVSPAPAPAQPPVRPANVLPELSPLPPTETVAVSPGAELTPNSLPPALMSQDGAGVPTGSPAASALPELVQGQPPAMAANSPQPIALTPTGSEPLRGMESPQPVKLAELATSLPPTGSELPMGMESPQAVNPAEPAISTDSAAKDRVFSAPRQAIALPETTAPVAALPSSTSIPQSIQDFVKLPSQSSWLPLTPQAATEAVTTNRVQQFTVFRLSPQDYQNMWRKSTQGLKDLAPANGFVDYSQQVIIVPRSLSEIPAQPAGASLGVTSAKSPLKTTSALSENSSAQPTGDLQGVAADQSAVTRAN